MIIINVDTPWRGPHYATRPRMKAIELLCFHWTAGTGGKTFADDIDTVWRRIIARKKPDGSPLRASVHYVIGRDGRVGCYADPVHVVAFGVGSNDCNSRGIHVEIVSPGVGAPSEKYPSETIVLPVRGRPTKQLRFLPAQMASAIELAKHLADLHEFPLAVPDPIDAQFTDATLRKYRGVMEHLHVPKATKRDAGSQIVRAIAALPG